LPVTITGANMTLDPALALVRVRFLVSLSDTDRTTIDFGPVVLNDNEGDYPCTLSAEASPIEVNLANACGDKLLMQFMRGSMPDLNIVSINPNPSHDAVKFTLQSSRERVTNVTVLDALGREMHREVVTIGREPKDVRVESSAWPSGVYVVRLESGGVVKSRMFVRE
jgi:hypothetical protein